MTTSPRTPAKPGLYQLHIALADSDPLIWRRVIVPQTITLARLHLVIQVAMGWENAHLHQYLINGVWYGVPDPDGESTIKSQARRSLVKTLGPETTFRYVYDLGDSWDHVVTVEQVVPRSKYRNLPTCIAGENACPPEDIGGLGGYEMMLEALGDPQHPEHGLFREFFPYGFDPQDFSQRDTNFWLKGLEV